MKEHNGFICHLISLRQNKEYSYSLISKERSYLMGFSIVWVMFFHSTFDLSGFTLLKIFHDFGNIGVDIFLFLSGVGLYYSANKLKKSNRKWIATFYKNRFFRIMPATIICLFPWYLYLYNGTLLNPIRVILDVTSLSFWIDGNNRGWYIALTIVLYCLYPLVNQFISPRNYRKNIMVCIGLSTTIIMINSAVSLLFPSWFDVVNIALGRIPIFLIGCFFAPIVFNKERFNNGVLVICYVVLPIISFLVYRFGSTLHIFGIHRYLYAILTVCIVLIFSRVSSLNHELLSFRFFSFLGRYTLELYLTHTQILSVMNDLLSKHLSSFWINVASIFISMTISIILHEMIERIINAVRKRKNRKGT